MVWQSIDVEREALADQLGQVDEAQWSTPSLCAGLTVREVLAHLTVSGAVSGPRWFAGVVRARFVACGWRLWTRASASGKATSSVVIPSRSSWR